MSSIDLSKLAATLGDFCRSNTPAIVGDLTVQNPAFQYFTHRAGVLDEEPLLDFEIASGIKPYSKNWNPTAIDIKPRILKVRKVKVEVELEPIRYQSTYLGHNLRRDPKGKEIPFEAFLMQKIIQKAREDVELKALYKGVHNSSGTTPGATMDGIDKLFDDMITAGDVTAVPTGAITSTNAVAKLEEVFTSLPEEWRHEEFLMLVSPRVYRAYCDDYRTRFGGNTSTTEYERKRLDGTRCFLMPQAGMWNSQRIYLTPGWNVFVGYDNIRGNEFVDVQPNRWVLDVLINFKIGVQIGSPDYVRVGL